MVDQIPVDKVNGKVAPRTRRVVKRIGDGCADLTIHPTSQLANGSSSSNLSVSLGAGRNLSIQIVSTQGATHATITVR